MSGGKEGSRRTGKGGREGGMEVRKDGMKGEGREGGGGTDGQTDRERQTQKLKNLT